MFLSHYRKHISLVDALSADDAAIQYISRERSEQSFDLFYDKSVVIAEKYDIGRPEFSRTRRCPSRFDGGSDPHKFLLPKEYFRQCTLKPVISSVVSLKRDFVISKFHLS